MFTVDDLNRHLRTSIREVMIPGDAWEVKNLAPRIVCADGYSVSVQASSTSYSTPRTNHGPWWKVECGYACPPDGMPGSTPPDEEAIRIVAEADAAGLDVDFLVRLRANRHLYVVVEEWREWAENAERGGDTVYGYVPVEAVVAWVNAHGGLAKEEA